MCCQSSAESDFSLVGLGLARLFSRLSLLDPALTTSSDMPIGALIPLHVERPTLTIAYQRVAAAFSTVGMAAAQIDKARPPRDRLDLRHGLQFLSS